MKGRSDGYSSAPTSPSLLPSKTMSVLTLRVNPFLLLPHIHSTHRGILEETLAVNCPSYRIPFRLRNEKLKERCSARHCEQNQKSRTRRKEQLLDAATLAWSRNTLDDSVCLQIDYGNLATLTSSNTLCSGWSSSVHSSLLGSASVKSLRDRTSVVSPPPTTRRIDLPTLPSVQSATESAFPHRLLLIRLHRRS